MKQKQILIAIILVSFAALSRIFCAQLGFYNFAPLVAIGLFSGLLISDIKYALLLALLGQFCADVYFQVFPTATNVGFYGWSQFFVYAALILAAFVGTKFRSINIKTVYGGTLIASIAFFVLSNLGVFFEGYYGYTFSGFINTYVMAIPFFKNSLLADFIGSSVIFAAYYTIKNFIPTKLVKA